MIGHLSRENDGPPSAGDVENIRRAGQGPVAHAKGSGIHGEFDVLSLDEETAANVLGKHNRSLIPGESQERKSPAGTPLRRSCEAREGHQRQEELAGNWQEPATRNRGETGD